MSTADCKTLLVQHYPHTQLKDWKRESKFKSALEDEIRRFRHPQIGAVLVNEDRETIGTDELAIEFRMHSTYNPADFYVSIVMLPEEDANFNMGAKAHVWVTYKDSFEKQDGSDDIHWSWLVKPFYPKGLHCDDAMERCFEVMEDLTEAQLRQKFLDAGFLFNDTFDANVRSDLGLDEPASQHGDTATTEAPKPEDFYFMVDSSFDLSEQLQVYLVRRRFFDEFGHLDSTHLGAVIKPLFPEGLTCDEEMESCFAIYEISDPVVLTQMFLDKGFVHMPKSPGDDNQH